MKAIILGIALALSLAGCPPAVTPLPDSGDAGPLFIGDAATSTCTASCVQLTAICGPQLATCPASLQHADTDALIRRPDGKPLTCACLAATRTKADVLFCGGSCQ